MLASFLTDRLVFFKVLTNYDSIKSQHNLEKYMQFKYLPLQWCLLRKISAKQLIKVTANAAAVRTIINTFCLQNNQKDVIKIGSNTNVKWTIPLRPPNFVSFRFSWMFFPFELIVENLTRTLVYHTNISRQFVISVIGWSTPPSLYQ